ncbi:hypothetical protein [Neochlamydia sp. S13]|jgi:hypothetical protein|uniref:hypothetical protein n=1 Tax=Neochlamydia sp. S13 TaxID=1353976 RepID=UPI001315754F|nr:hypothetical protein [Neochlamydia sp. S13]
MIEKDIDLLISIFCDVEACCKQFEPEWRKILVENHPKPLIGKNNKPSSQRN